MRSKVRASPSELAGGGGMKGMRGMKRRWLSRRDPR